MHICDRFSLLEQQARIGMTKTKFTVTVTANVTMYSDQSTDGTVCGYGVAAYNSAGKSAYVTDYAFSQ